MKRFGFILCFCFVSFNVCAEKIDTLAIKKHIKIIQKEKCPEGRDLSDVTWVKKRVSCLCEIDQYVRTQTDFDFTKETIALGDKMDKNNTNEIKEILKVHGWLTISKFGEEADQNAWLLVQHADHDPEFQSSIAFLLEQLVPMGETAPSNFAYLYDRVAVKYQHLGLKQKFGTQAFIKDGKTELEPFQGNVKELNIRRKKMGLGSIEEYMEILRKVNKTK